MIFLLGLVCGICAAIVALGLVRNRDDEYIERHRMQLAACSQAALGNSRSNRQARLKRENAYWSQAYADVCRAVDAEIESRELLAEVLGDDDPRTAYTDAQWRACLADKAEAEQVDLVVRAGAIRRTLDQLRGRQWRESVAGLSLAPGRLPERATLPDDPIL